MYYGENAGNLIIRGDNTLVLERLRSQYEGKIKCIYIDPPYNNGENYAHYTDKDSSSNWLENMKIFYQNYIVFWQKMEAYGCLLMTRKFII